MAHPYDLSILIVSHGQEELLHSCIRSLAPALEGLTAELILVDNLNRRKLAPLFENSPFPVTLQENPKPLGFAANINQAVAAATGRDLLILNPDIIFHRGGLKQAVEFLHHRPEIALLSCRLLNPDGSPQQSYRHFPSLAVLLLRGLAIDRWPWRPAFYRELMMESHQLDSPQPVDWVFGACMIIPRDYFQSIRGMDQKFRLYYEDVDLCLRIWKSRREVWFYPDTSFFHQHLRTSAKRPFSRTWRWHLRSACRYFLKHHYFFRPRRFAPTHFEAANVSDPSQAGHA